MGRKKIEEDPRATKILEMELAGFSTVEIAADLGVDTSTVWRIKQRPTFLGILENNRAKYDTLLDEMSDSDQMTIRLAALQERGRLDRSGTKILAAAEMKRMEQKQPGCGEGCPHWPEFTMRKRQETNYLVNEVLRLTAKQIRRWAAYAEKVKDNPFTIGDGAEEAAASLKKEASK